jgi:hypothetical protein
MSSLIVVVVVDGLEAEEELFCRVCGEFELSGRNEQEK